MTIDHKTIADVFMLALIVWREARGESREAQTGVAFSLMNRVARPSWWGNDVLSVAGKKWQYSSFTDPRDPQLTTWPKSGDDSWWACMDVAQAVIDGTVDNPVPGADSYYDISIKAPNWATPDMFVRQIGRLRFFNVDRDLEK